MKLSSTVVASLLLAGTVAGADREPIIDVHLHGYPMDEALPPIPSPATGQPTGLEDGAALLQATLAQMRRYNVVRGVVSGGSGDRLAVARRWRDDGAGLLFGAAGIRGSAAAPLPEIGELRKALTEGGLMVLGEVSAQYAGLTLSDPKYEPYLALAEELDIPVAVHTGIAPPGTSYQPCCPGFRVSLGNPALVEEALNRHPKLRVSLMHAGWPYLAETVALMAVYPQVYADLGAIDWLIPRAEFHAYLQALMRAELGKRLMFGSDQMYWPEGIGLAIEGIESATFLTPEQKRDIFYNNAVRFLRLEKELGPVTR
jgi:hypothetical protein